MAQLTAGIPRSISQGVSRSQASSLNRSHAPANSVQRSPITRLTYFSDQSIQKHMSPIPQLSATQLHHAAEIQTKIEALQAELARLLYGTSAPAENRTRSSAGRARTIAGSKAYWARRRAAAKPTKAKSVTAAPAKRRTISPAGRRKLAASATARWAKAKAAGKTRL